MSADGKTIVGFQGRYGNDTAEAIVLKGKESQRLPKLPGTISYFAKGCSRDGKIIVGGAVREKNKMPPYWLCIWDEIHGVRDLEGILRGAGILPDYYTIGVQGTDFKISSDGNVFLGKAINIATGRTEPYVASIS